MSRLLLGLKKAMAAIAVGPRSTTPDDYRDLIARDTVVAGAANIKIE